jgi:AcrR family transcriptional regulator
MSSESGTVCRTVAQKTGKIALPDHGTAVAGRCRVARNYYSHYNLGMTQSEATGNAAPGGSLRELKKHKTRQHIVDTAAALFEERSYETVTVADVARLAEVSEQTVYNYFASKEGLVFDEAGAFVDRFSAIVRSRPVHEPLIDAVTRDVHEFLENIGNRRLSRHRKGGMPYLVVASPVVRHAWLSLVERFAKAIADGLVARDGYTAGAATVVGWSIASVFLVIVDSAGHAAQKNKPVDTRRLRPQIQAALNFLKRGLGEGDVQS